MKKIILVVFIAVLSGSFLFAQEFKKGVRLGANYGTGVLKDFPAGFENKYEWSFSAGVFGELKMPSDYAIGVEVLYGRQVSKLERKDATTNSSNNETIFFNNIEIPVLFKKYWEGFHIFLGPEIEFKLDAKADKEVTVNGITTEQDGVDVSKQFRVFDVQAVGGIGYVLDMGLFADLRYNYGLLNRIKETNDYHRDSKYHHSYFTLSLGYKF